MQFQFENYSAEELVRCGQHFKQNFSSRDAGQSSSWTHDVIQWFAKTAPDRASVYASGLNFEFLVDLCHLDFPKHTETIDRAGRWSQALREDRCSMLLALESEWGNSRKTLLCNVLDDAHKLALLKANVKVLLFGTFDPGRREMRNEIIDAVSRLRHTSSDEAPWLCIDIPYQGQLPPDVARDIEYWLLA